MKIFDTYTGSAMLNNALMTIEALGDLNNVSEITSDIILELYEGRRIKELNKRLKSYTMLFTKNGPLKNDKKTGDLIYDFLMKKILQNFESNGEKTCEISGLKFQTSFENIFIKALSEIGLPEKDILKKDTTINRSWFPLIGSLGSDAQALPQAKFTVQIHPICIVIMQFLPLSAFLYKGGVLLIDSSNFEFSRSFIRSNVKNLQQRIEIVRTSESIENVKDYSKGNYLLMAMEILSDKNLDDTYSELNLWSFSNSGTGARCEIDRVPNDLIQKLVHLNNNPECKSELTTILSKPNSADDFLKHLADNVEWWGLYPNVFGSGKKKVVYEGMTIPFLEAYFKEINSLQKIEYAKYLSYLIKKYKSKFFDNYLSSVSAFNEKNYRIDLYSVLIAATKNGEWNLGHHLNILDDSNLVPIRNSFYRIHRITHYYYQKKAFNIKIPKPILENSYVEDVCNWIISIIQKDIKYSTICKQLVNVQEYTSFNFGDLFLRAVDSLSIDLGIIMHTLYDYNLTPCRRGLNELLRIFFSQDKKVEIELEELHKPANSILEPYIDYLIATMEDFSQDYQDYYFEKYKNSYADTLPNNKFYQQILSIPVSNTHFLSWFREAIENVNIFLKEKEKNVPDKWTDSTFLYNQQGDYIIEFSKFAIKFLLLKRYFKLNTIK